MGWRVWASNSAEALTTPGVEWAKILSAPWWVVATTAVSRLSRYSRKCAGEGGAFAGVGAGAEFIEQDEGVGAGFGEDADDVGDVGGEGGEGLFDALFVADVGEDVGEDGDAGAVFGGDGEAGLGHEGE